MFHVLGFCAQGRYGELADYLLTALDGLTAAGADFAALSANTPHIVFDRLCKGCDLPLVSIVECARDVGCGTRRPEDLGRARAGDQAP